MDLQQRKFNKLAANAFRKYQNHTANTFHPIERRMDLAEKVASNLMVKVENQMRGEERLALTAIYNNYLNLKKIIPSGSWSRTRW